MRSLFAQPDGEIHAPAGGGLIRRGLRLGPTALLCGLLVAAAGCALPYSLKPGERVDDVRQRLGRPGAEHAAPDGGRRLEYRSGRQTFMLDFDSQDRLLRWENVLDTEHFERVRAGITREQLRAQLGAPWMEWRVRYHDQTVWTYRFVGPFCLVFHVGITPQGIVEDTSYGPDSRCERDERMN